MRYLLLFMFWVSILPLIVMAQDTVKTVRPDSLNCQAKDKKVPGITPGHP